MAKSLVLFIFALSNHLKFTIMAKFKLFNSENGSVLINTEKIIYVDKHPSNKEQTVIQLDDNKCYTVNSLFEEICKDLLNI